MKKRKKVMISAATAFLSIAAIGVSYALYKIEPDPKIFSLYTGTTKTVQFTISEPSADIGLLNPGTGIGKPGTDATTENPEGTDGSVINTFKVGGDLHSASSYTQDIIMGELVVEITLPNKNYANALVFGKSHIMVDVNNDGRFSYVDDYEYDQLEHHDIIGNHELGRRSYEEFKYFETTGVDNVIRVEFEEFPAYLVGTNVKLIRQISLESDPNHGSQQYISFEDYIEDIAGIEPTEIKIYWDPIDYHHRAFVVGNMSDSNWQPVQKYGMVSDPKHTAHQFIYKTTFAEGVEFSAIQLLEIDENNNEVYSPIVGNVEITAQNAGPGRVIFQNKNYPPFWDPV